MDHHQRGVFTSCQLCISFLKGAQNCVSRIIKGRIALTANYQGSVGWAFDSRGHFTAGWFWAQYSHIGWFIRVEIKTNGSPDSHPQLHSYSFDWKQREIAIRHSSLPFARPNHLAIIRKEDFIYFVVPIICGIMRWGRSGRSLPGDVCRSSKWKWASVSKKWS